MLAQTLACLAANGFDRAAAAASLPVHRNTLLYRINRIEKLSGLDLDLHAHRELVRLAAIWKNSGAVPTGLAPVTVPADDGVQHLSGLGPVPADGFQICRW